MAYLEKVLQRVGFALIAQACRGDESEADALEYLFKISHQYGANMVMLRADNTADAIIRFVQKNDVSTLLLGRAGKPREWDLVAELKLRLPGIDIRTVWPNDVPPVS